MPSKPLAAYTLVAILTFGYNASTTIDGAVDTRYENDRIIASFLGAALWPMYWSWVSFDHVKDLQK